MKGQFGVVSVRKPRGYFYARYMQETDMGRIILPGQTGYTLPETPRPTGHQLILPGQAEPVKLDTAERGIGQRRIILPGEEDKPLLSVAGQLDEIEARDLVWAEGGTVHYESIIESQYPQINVMKLCACLDDALMDWTKAKRDYLDRHGKAIDV